MKRYTTRHLAPDDARHGTDNAYTNCGCRCLPCKQAHGAALSAYMAANPRKAFAATVADDTNNATRRAVTTTNSAMTREEYYRRNADTPRVVVTRHNSIGQLLAGDFR